MGSPGTAFDALAVVFETAGFECVEDQHHPEAFGSRLAMYRKADLGYRVIWDGKEEWLLLEVRQGGQFEELHREVIGRDEATVVQIARLRATLEQRMTPDSHSDLEGGTR